MCVNLGSGIYRFVGCWDGHEDFLCDLCDPCMKLSCALIIVQIFSCLGLYFILDPRISRKGITVGIKDHVATLGSLCYASTMVLFSIVYYYIMVATLISC